MVLAILMIVAAGIYRLLPHPMNVAPVAAMALLGGMYFGRRYALWVPLAVLALTDLVLNMQMGYPILYFPRGIDYAAFLLIGALGMWSRTRRPVTKIGCAAVTPFLFYLVSNFGVWLFGLNLASQPYPKTLAGLAECYVAALPFLRGTMTGDWAFMAVFAAAVVLVRQTANTRLNWLVTEARA
ncbi:MAG: DUF6580 family putative transport protein [Verrucomicrobiia bacterium]